MSFICTYVLNTHKKKKSETKSNFEWRVSGTPFNLRSLGGGRVSFLSGMLFVFVGGLHSSRARFARGVLWCSCFVSCSPCNVKWLSCIFEKEKNVI